MLNRRLDTLGAWVVGDALVPGTGLHFLSRDGARVSDTGLDCRSTGGTTDDTGDAAWD